jgi:hypothetical protein
MFSFDYFHLLCKDNNYSLFATSSVSEGNNPEKLITCLPGNIPPLKPTDLLSQYRAQDPSDILFNAGLYESQKQSKGDYVLVNTFEKLEGRDAVTALSLNGCPALVIGHLFLPNFFRRKGFVQQSVGGGGELPDVARYATTGISYIRFFWEHRREI